MRAARIHEYGPPDVFRIEQITPPAIGAHDVLVEVHASGINPIDAKIRSGSQRAVVRHELPVVLGLDVSGVVTQVGAKVTKFVVGDEVFGSPTHKRQGSYAELIAVDETELAKKPARLTHVEAASIPLVAQTAWQCLVRYANVSAGDKVLIQAGSGGVGTFAIQLAKQLGASVATTCSTRNIELVKRLGADVVIDYTRERFDDVLTGYDVVLDSVGGNDLVRARRVLRRGGRLVYIGTRLPEHVARYGVYPGTVVTMLKILGFAASSRLVGKRANVVVRKPNGEQLARVADLLQSGKIMPVVERTFRLEEVAEAHRAIEGGRTRGKLVLDLRA